MKSKLIGSEKSYKYTIPCYWFDINFMVLYKDDKTSYHDHSGKSYTLLLKGKYYEGIMYYNMVASYWSDDVIYPHRLRQPRFSIIHKKDKHKIKGIAEKSYLLNITMRR